MQNSNIIRWILRRLPYYISTNHELVWFTFGVIGASCSIYGVYLNHKKTMLAEEMANIEKRIKLKQVEGDNDDPPVSPI